MALTTSLRRVCVGSGSDIKIAAAQQAFPDASVCAVADAPSGVPPQPVGREETRRGATNRARAAQAARPDCDAWIGIENGMWERAPGVFEDAAIVAFIVRGASAGEERVVYAESDAIEIPPVHLRPFPPGRNGEWSSVKDPHAVLSGGEMPRAKLLAGALERALIALKA
jgi:non-canonical (house-cleaning) NTP pyrophosphatase